MTEPVGRRKLPPLSPKTDETEVEVPRARRKKRRPPEGVDPSSDSTGQRPRSNSRTADGGSDAEAAAGPGTSTGSSGAPYGSASLRTNRRRQPKPQTADGSAEENFANRGVEDTPDQPKKKRKPKPVSQSREELITDGEVPNTDRSAGDPNNPGRQKKRRKKRKTNAVSEVEESELGLEAELHDIKDDVVTATEATEGIADANWTTPAMRSEATDKLFIEQRGGFKKADKTKLALQRAEEEERNQQAPVSKDTHNTLYYALRSQKGFRTFAMFLQGMFAGITLWQIITTFLLRNQGWDIFLEQYHLLASPVQSVYFFLFAFATVVAFDRYDVGRPSRHCWLRAATFKSGGIACLFYFAGLMFSVSIAAVDDKISMSQNVTQELWTDDAARSSQLDTWIIINTIRGILPILGWFVISLSPVTDRLYKNMEKADENILDAEMEVHEVKVNGYHP